MPHWALQLKLILAIIAGKYQPCEQVRHFSSSLMKPVRSFIIENRVERDNRSKHDFCLVSNLVVFHLDIACMTCSGDQRYSD
jgi:hypothetical protein